MDTTIFIYFIEEVPRYMPVVAPFFAAVASGQLRAATSGITLMELLVVPLRRGDQALADQYDALLRRSAHLELISLDAQMMRDAAAVRAHTRARTPDALQLAAGLRAGCDAFLTNDHRMPTVSPRMPTVQLESLLSAGPPG